MYFVSIMVNEGFYVATVVRSSETTPEMLEEMEGNSIDDGTENTSIKRTKENINIVETYIGISCKKLNG